jgi:hypothetical protein
LHAGFLGLDSRCGGGKGGSILQRDIVGESGGRQSWVDSGSDLFVDDVNGGG